MSTDNNANDTDDGDLSKLILLDEKKIVLSERDFLRFVDRVENPPPRTPAFERAILLAYQAEPTAKRAR